jgi:hypothetical protein
MNRSRPEKIVRGEGFWSRPWTKFGTVFPSECGDHLRIRSRAHLTKDPEMILTDYFLIKTLLRAMQDSIPDASRSRFQ